MGEIIRADHVSMNFRMNVNHTTSMKEWVIAKLKKNLKYRDFYALNDVSFSVQRGEIVGIVGTNGSGKSTLLKVISGIYKPTKGSIVTAGRVAPMLELGSGFDYELSGRENIFLNGMLLGLVKRKSRKSWMRSLLFPNWVNSSTCLLRATPAV